MLTLWNPLTQNLVRNSDNKISTKDYFDRIFENSFNSAFNDLIWKL